MSSETLPSGQAKWGLAKVQWQTGCMQRRLEYMRMVLDDARRHERLEEALCQVCFYGTRINGQSSKSSPCQMCGVEMQFTTTATDRLCRQCALAHRLCRTCGGDVNSRGRRKL